ncbi:DUF6906 family protein [Bacillus sp. Au-Bac7]|uniref:DUF6906 family protein n=1 Tax=Bacillus sp. Au-Bac7 TaxID=2906458 RepID=UPI001E5C3740|nr:hypothetical protein [Bacillus sp. Au-Bac7]MCE4051995.1 hypothetical protein [Bacillus sp. Au-Bac7]
MKNGKKPTRRQKGIIKLSGLNPENWLIYKANGDRLSLVHRYTGTTRKVFKE